MRKILISFLTMASLNAHADVSATFTAASNYIWRGISFSSTGAASNAQGSPVLQGSFDYSHASGFAAGFFTGNVDSTNFSNAPITVEKDTEADLYASYTHKINDGMSVGVNVLWLNYLRNPDNNTTSYEAFLTWNILRLDVSHISKYFGLESSDLYVKLGARQNLTEKMGWMAHVGSTTFGDEKIVDMKNYVDGRVGLFYSVAPFTVEAAYTNTNRKMATVDKEYKDQAVTLSLSATF